MCIPFHRLLVIERAPGRGKGIYAYLSMVKGIIPESVEANFRDEVMAPGLGFRLNHVSEQDKYVHLLMFRNNHYYRHIEGQKDSYLLQIRKQHGKNLSFITLS